MDLSRIINPPDDFAVSAPGTDRAEDTEEEEEQNLPGISFIVAMEAKDEGKVSYVSPSALELIGWDPDEVIGSPASLYTHPDDALELYRAYQEMISEDKAACLMYFRVAFKDKSKGYLLCSTTISRAGPHLIGACSPATLTAKAMHDTSTVNEIIIVTPSASRLAFTRWNVPSESELQVSSTSPPASSSSKETTPSSPDNSITGAPEKLEPDEVTNIMQHLTLSPPSKPDVAPRVAFVLDRFSKDVPVIYATNDDILPRSLVLGRSFYDFVAPGDEKRVRTAIDTVKGSGVDEKGGPNDGGFAFNRFHLYLRGRDSSIHQVRKRRSLHTDTVVLANDASTAPVGRKRSRSRIMGERGPNTPSRDTMLVDVILSPQSDGIIVILRPALQTGITPT